MLYWRLVGLQLPIYNIHNPIGLKLLTRLNLVSVTLMNTNSHQRCSIIKSVLRNFAKITGKQLRQSLFFNKVAGLKFNFYGVCYLCVKCTLHLIEKKKVCKKQKRFGLEIAWQNWKDWSVWLTRKMIYKKEI